MTYPRQQLARLARQALRDQRGDLTAARQQVRGALTADPSLRTALLDELIDAAVEASIGMEHRRQNAAIYQAAGEPVAALARFLLLDTVLGTSGVRLRAATRPLVEREARFHQTQARTMAARGAFFAAIAAALPDAVTTVEAALSEDTLQALFEDAQHATV